MNAISVAAIVFAAALVVIFIRGHRILKKREKRLEEIAREEQRDVRKLAYVAYHGGHPDLPVPQKLTAALTEDALVLVTNRGDKTVLPMQDWVKLEKFTTKRKHDVKQRSMVLWGPFNNVMFKDQIRHFIVVNYRHGRNEDPDNHILIELGNPDERDKVFAEIDRTLTQFRRSGPVAERGRPAEADLLHTS